MKDAMEDWKSEERWEELKKVGEDEITKQQKIIDDLNKRKSF